MNRQENKASQTGAERGSSAKLEEDASKRPSGGRPRILALENEPCLSLLEIFRPDLEESGFELLTTSDEHEALQILLTQPIALFVVNLAGRMWLLRLIKAEPRLRQLSVLVVSGYSKLGAIDMLRRAGLVLYRDLDGYLEKPFMPEDLFTFIGTILARRGRV